MIKSIKFPKLRRFEIFDHLYVFFTLLPLVFAVYKIDGLDSSISQTLAIYTIASHLIWLDLYRRLSIVAKDIYLTDRRHRVGYKEDILSNSKIALIEITIIILFSLFVDDQSILMSFIDVNLFLLIVEMMMFTKEKPAIKEKISNENAELRFKLISIFYDRHLLRIQDDSIAQYLELGEIDYYLNYSNLTEDDYQDLRSRLDDMNLDRMLEVDFFLSKISCESLLHAFKAQETDKLRKLKEKTIESCKIRSLYDAMRYLD